MCSKLVPGTESENPRLELFREATGRLYFQLRIAKQSMRR